MKIETITRRKLTASDGMVLTEGENYGRVIFLSEDAYASAWHEITDAEYEKIMREEEAKC